MRVGQYNKQTGVVNPNVEVEKPYTNPLTGAVQQAAGQLGNLAQTYSAAKTNSDYSSGIRSMNNGVNTYLRHFTENLESKPPGQDAEEYWKELWGKDAEEMHVRIMETVGDTRARDELEKAWLQKKDDTQNLLLNRAQDIDINVRGAEMMDNYTTGLEESVVDTEADLAKEILNMETTVDLGREIFWSSADAYRMNKEGTDFLNNKYKQVQYDKEYKGYFDELKNAYNRNDITFTEAYNGANEQIKERVENPEMQKGLYEINQEMYDTAKAAADDQLAAITQDQRNWITETYQDPNNDSMSAFTQINAFINDNTTGKNKEDLYKLNETQRKQAKLKEDEQGKVYREALETDIMGRIYADEYTEDQMEQALISSHEGMEVNQDLRARAAWKRRQTEREDALKGKLPQSTAFGLKSVQDAFFNDNMDAGKFAKLLTDLRTSGDLSFEDSLKYGKEAEGKFFDHLNNTNTNYINDRIEGLELDPWSENRLKEEVRSSIYSASIGYKGQADAFALPLEDIESIINNWTEKAVGYKINSAYSLREDKTLQTYTDAEQIIKAGMEGDLFGTMSDNSLYSYASIPGMTEDDLKNAVGMDMFHKNYKDLSGQEKSIAKLNVAMGNLIRAQKDLFNSEIKGGGYEVIIGNDGLPYFWNEDTKRTYMLRYSEDQNEEIWHNWKGNNWEPDAGHSLQHRYLEGSAEAVLNNVKDAHGVYQKAADGIGIITGAKYYETPLPTVGFDRPEEELTPSQEALKEAQEKARGLY